MKRLWFFLVILLLGFLLTGCNAKAEELVQPAEDAEEQHIRQLVEEFGGRLQNVSLLAPKDIVNKSMVDNYGEFVSDILLKKWQQDPQNAPGRLVSSPWPDRIDILTVEKQSDNLYKVKGEIIEVTSVEKEKGGYAAKRPITLIIRKIDDRWLIDELVMGSYQQKAAISYENIQYGFNFSLPKSWEDYTIVTNNWEGLAFGDEQGEKIVETGPIISIRHPQWTSENPRQDIPIMIFTINQWNLLQKGNFHIGAAPIGPSELGRSTEYVFALPARYNFAFLTGFEEVEEILKGNPLHKIRN